MNGWAMHLRLQYMSHRLFSFRFIRRPLVRLGLAVQPTRACWPAGRVGQLSSYTVWVTPSCIIAANLLFVVLLSLRLLSLFMCMIYNYYHVLQPARACWPAGRAGQLCRGFSGRLDRDRQRVFWPAGSSAEGFWAEGSPEGSEGRGIGEGGIFCGDAYGGAAI